MAAGQSPSKSLGALLKRLREERDQTQKEVAQALGISQSALSAWESGVTLPPRPQIDRIAVLFGVGLEMLEPYFEAAEMEENYAPRSVGRIHFQAAQHVKRYGPENLSIWILGVTNLSVMENPFVQDRWRVNLRRGIDYNIIWFLDLVSEESFRAAVALFAEIEKRAAAAPQTAEPETAGASLGTICHYATSAFEAPSELMLAFYHQLEQELGADARGGPHEGKRRVHPYIAGRTSAAMSAQEQALAEASAKLLRLWQPDTGIVLYRPKTITTPPTANIRLMPVSEHIIEGLSPEAEQSQYWFWLSPRGAARLSNAVSAFEAALQEVEAQS
jgi:transcriptional regulator with XRE-family HTH domain